MNTLPSMQEITSDELEIDKLMLLKDGHCLKQHALAACSLQNKTQESDFDSTTLYTLNSNGSEQVRFYVSSAHGARPVDM